MKDFSIVIPTYGRADSLALLLRGVARLDYPSEKFEVIVVDDGGPAPLDGMVAGCGEGLRLRLLRQRNLGPAAARNYGARQAEGRYLVFTDDDCVPDRNWLLEIKRAFHEAPDAVCGGRTTNLDAGNLPAQATQLLMDYLYENYNPVSRSGAFYPANNMAVPREEFWRLGGFDEQLRFGEDREFCHRWHSQGGLFVLRAAGTGAARTSPGPSHLRPASFPVRRGYRPVSACVPRERAGAAGVQLANVVREADPVGIG